MKKPIIAGLVICMACAFVFLGCDATLDAGRGGDGIFSGSSNSNGNNPSANAGTLTIYDIPSNPSYSGITFRVYICSSDSNYLSNIEAYGSSTFSPGTISINLYDYYGYRWAGGGWYYIFIEDSGGNLVAQSSWVYFSNGSAQISASNLTTVSGGGLPWASYSVMPLNNRAGGSLTTPYQEIWYSFEAYSGINYSVQWYDSDNSGSSYCDIIVSAYESNGSPIRENVDNETGNTIPIPYSSTNRTIYLKVQGLHSSNTGYYEIMYYY
jgi:hypothetical protein